VGLRIAGHFVPARPSHRRGSGWVIRQQRQLEGCSFGPVWWGHGTYRPWRVSASTWLDRPSEKVGSSMRSFSTGRLGKYHYRCSVILQFNFKLCGYNSWCRWAGQTRMSKNHIPDASRRLQSVPNKASRWCVRAAPDTWWHGCCWCSDIFIESYCIDRVLRQFVFQQQISRPLPFDRGVMRLRHM
jgi:hypothetical protein